VKVAGLAAAVLGLVASVNCGGGGETNTGGTTNSGTTTGTGGTAQGGGGSGTGGTSTSNVPPTAPPATAPDGTGTTVFAIKKLYLGDTKPDGSSDPTNGWKYYGYNLDNKISTKTATDLCKPRNNTNPAQVYPDGNGGNDNSFGKNILPIITGLAPDASTQINDSFNQGKFTLMIALDQLGSGAQYNPLAARFYAGGDLGGTPKWDGSDKWPVVPELLNDPNDITSAKIKFASSYVVGNEWVSGTQSDIVLSLSIKGFNLNLTIANAWITFNMDAAHKHVTGGQIGGVLATDSLISELQKIAGAFDTQFCDPTNATFQSIAGNIEGASDILKNGTQDPTKECDGISIGIGFDAELVQLGPVGQPSAATGDPCKDGG
jgi:hypothetical protein